MAKINTHRSCACHIKKAYLPREIKPASRFSLLKTALLLGLVSVFFILNPERSLGLVSLSTITFLLLSFIALATFITLKEDLPIFNKEITYDL